HRQGGHVQPPLRLPAGAARTRGLARGAVGPAGGLGVRVVGDGAVLDRGSDLRPPDRRPGPAAPGTVPGGGRVKRIRLVGRGRPHPNPAASMALLQEVLDRPLDPGYASAAQARQERGLEPSTGGRTLLLLVVSLLLGFLLAVAVVTLRAPDPDANTARAELIERIQELEALGDERAALIET